MNDFFRIVKRYLLEYLPLQRNFSENTVKSYRQGLNLFVTYLRDVAGIPVNRITFSECTREAVLGYLDWLSAERHCSPTSVNQRLMILRSFLKYAGETDCTFVAFGMDVATVPTRKTKGRQVDFLTEPALKALLAQPNVGTKAGHRNQFFMILMYDVAARCGELLNLTLRYLRYDELRPVVFLHGKGNKTRSVPLLPETVAHCRQYVRMFHGDNPQDKDALVFYTKNHGANTQMSADTVALFMKNYATLAREAHPDFPKNLHPHMLRHTRAMHLYRQGMPIHLLSEFLGHANFETTKIYAHADTEMKRTAVAKADIVRQGMPAAEPIWMDDEDIIFKLSGLR